MAYFAHRLERRLPRRGYVQVLVILRLRLDFLPLRRRLLLFLHVLHRVLAIEGLNYFSECFIDKRAMLILKTG